LTAAFKTRLLLLLQQACDEEQAFAASLTAAERSEAGAPMDWSAKDSQEATPYRRLATFTK
jgi:hypothetical protein